MADVMLNLGGYLFSVNNAAYNDLTRVTTRRWAEIDRLGSMTALQDTGTASDEITLAGVVYAQYRAGTNQLNEMRALLNTGKPQMLVAGTGRVLGEWVILSLQEKQSIFAAEGVAKKQEFTIKLKKYE